MAENFTIERFHAFYLFVTTGISPNNNNNLQIVVIHCTIYSKINQFIFVTKMHCFVCDVQGEAYI
jgi:hypothetical protein